MSTCKQTCLENLNHALIDLAKQDEKIIFLGEDIKEPYGGAFKVEKNFSTLFPDRVISTPISEEGFSGFAAGLAIQGYKPIVDFMFSDFMTLSFDMIINFLSKYPQMYGRNLPLSMVLRSANGGYRGYGATHSQSMQKFFMGIPNIYVFEMSPFHDNKLVFEQMFAKNKTCIFFEEKKLYNTPVYINNEQNIFKLTHLGKGKNWAHLSTGASTPACTILCPGGITPLVLGAAEELLLNYEIETDILVPSQLYPCEMLDIMHILQASQHILVVEESTPGINFGSHILEELSKLAEDKTLLSKIKLLSSRNSVIPANINLEKQILVGQQDILDAVLAI